MAKKRKIMDIEKNNALLNAIAPIGLSFENVKLRIGDNIGRVYSIIKYPPEMPYGWYSKLTNIQGTVAAVTVRPVESYDFVDAISKSVRMKQNQASSEKDVLAISRAEKAAEDGEKLLKKVDQEGESVVMLSTSLLAFSADEKNFEKTRRRTESASSVARCKIRAMSSLQKEALKHVSPFYTKDDEILSISERIAPLSTFFGGFPFASSGFSDGEGYYFGKDADGGLSIIDPWKRENDRTNTNFAIMGVAGVGKSTIVKHIAISEYMLGTKIIFVDPEREYKDLCKNLSGDWINTGGGTGGRINPLQIRPVPVDEEDENFYQDEGNGMGDMALYIKNLEIFFNLYIPSLTDMHKALLKESLIELYNKFNIYWDTDINKLGNKDFPIMSDLFDLIEAKALSYAKDENSGFRDTAKLYYELALFLKDIAYGSDSFLWNGHTTIETATRCICLDTHDLQNASDNIKSTQYFNILTWAWQEMSKDRTERVLLICDEAYLMIDPRVPQSLVFLRNVEKRGRKYEAGVAIISHSVVDFLDPQIKMYGQALLDIPCYKILMGTDGQNLEETRKLYKLTEAEESLLAQKKRGVGLCIIGSKRLQINFEIPEYKFEYFGKAGGR